MAKVTLNIMLTLQGPILTQASTPGDYGLDAAMARKQDGTPYLPGTLILGRLRQSLEELSEATDGQFIPESDIVILFGKGSDSRKKQTTQSVLPQRKLLQATDFVAASQWAKDTLFRIRMDKVRGSVATGAYLVIDSPFGPGAEVAFTGTITYLIPDGESDYYYDKIDKGLRWITSFGGERTVGFGRVLKVEVASSASRAVPSEALDHQNSYYRLRIRPDGPFCIARRQVDENLFESEEIIPGNVIKGGLASTWGMMMSNKRPNEEISATFDATREELAANFANIRFTHAFPVDKVKNIRPTRFPLSLIKYSDLTKDEKEFECLEDVARHDGPKPLGGMKQAPAFSIDWKDSGNVYGRFGWPRLQRELRVRTAMNRSTRKSRDQQLFAYEMIVPDGHEWEGEIDLSRVPADVRGKVALQLVDLLGHGLNGWSKTKTTASALIQAKQPCQVPPPRDGNLYQITLQTPALLCKPGTDGLNEASTAQDLFNAYSDVWAQLSGNTLKLVRFFAGQSLAGGYYLHQRFQSCNDYYPWLLTDAGSVFVLEAANGSAADKVEDWLRHGLPLPEWAVERYGRKREEVAIPGSDWRACPFIPENGFGEIAVNLDLENFPVVKEGGDE